MSSAMSGAPRVSIHRIALPSGSPEASTATVPDHCAVQLTARMASRCSGASASRRCTRRVSVAHHTRGSCSTPPSGVKISGCGSASHASNSPRAETTAALTAVVPKSSARIMPHPHGSTPSPLSPTICSVGEYPASCNRDCFIERLLNINPPLADEQEGG